MKSKFVEKTIVEKICQKDSQTLYSFYKKHYSLVMHLVRRQITDYSSAEEITQEVFIDFIEGMRNFAGRSSLKTYLVTITRNKVIDYIRKKKIKKILFSAVPEYIWEKITPLFQENDLEKVELAKNIEQTLNKLPNDYQLVLRLRYMEDEKVLSIAKRMKLQFKAAESLLFRARKAFITLYKRHY